LSGILSANIVAVDYLHVAETPDLNNAYVHGWFNPSYLG